MIAASRDVARRAKKHYKLMTQLFPEEIEYSVENSRIYLDGYSFESLNSKPAASNIKVVEADSVSAVYDHRNGKTAALNFSSFKYPGGAYLAGSATQEEMLCAESTLFPVLLEFKESFYKPHRHMESYLYNSDAIYSPDIIFTRDSSFIKADVITIAAPNLMFKDRLNIGDEEACAAMKSRVDAIFYIAEDNKVDTLILGAFGCGIFNNNPYTVSKLFKKASIESSIPNIIFAIPGGDNLNIFLDTLSS